MNVTLAMKVAPWWVGTFLETTYISNLKASHALLIWSELHRNTSWVGKFQRARILRVYDLKLKRYGWTARVIRMKIGDRREEAAD